MPAEYSITRLGGRLLPAALAITVAATALLAGSPHAQAASLPANTLTGHTVLVVPAGRTVSATVGASHLRVVGSTTATTCTFNVFTPFRYYGGPYGGGEEGIANIQCAGNVSQLFIEVGLFKNGTQVTYNSNTSSFTNLVVVDTEYPVSAGNYYTGADGTETDAGATTTFAYRTSSTVYLH
ncbi:MAG: hypothetical protein ABIP57_18635 [Jatrophihabitantaceae bacterium]